MLSYIALCVKHLFLHLKYTYTKHVYQKLYTCTTLADTFVEI